MRGLELNEVEWWSFWTDVHWFGDSYIMLSTDFLESFFNRAGFVDCGSSSQSIPRIEAEFANAKTQVCFAVSEECKELGKELGNRGYIPFDGMAVLRLDGPKFKTSSNLSILTGQDVSIEDWASAYSLSFYDDHRYQEQVSRIAKALQGERSVTLMEGKKDGRTVGILAAFRTPDLLGVYCVGTLVKYRKMGVAGSLINEASRIALEEGRTLFLQTMLSDEIEDFYLNGGFHRLYVKRFMREEVSGS